MLGILTSLCHALIHGFSETSSIDTSSSRGETDENPLYCIYCIVWLRMGPIFENLPQWLKMGLMVEKLDHDG